MNLSATLFSEPWIQRLGWVLLHFIWQGMAIALLLALVLRLLVRASSHVRYGVIAGAFLICGIMPVATWMVLDAQSEIAPQAAIAATPIDVSKVEVPARPDANSYLSSKLGAPGETESRWQDRVYRLANAALPYAVCLWFGGVLVLTFRLTLGWTLMRRICRSGLPIQDRHCLERFRQVLKRMQVGVPVQLLESALVEVPTLIGWLRPMILIPASVFAGLTPDQLDSILAHELAHVRRYDFLVNFFQTIIETILFYHPAVWWISGKLREERENCCDDMALEVMADRLVYVSALAQLEEGRAMPLALSASGGPLLQRIRRIVGVNERRVSAWPLWVLVLGILMTAFPLAKAQNNPVAGPSAKMSEAEARQKGIAAVVNQKVIYWSDVSRQDAETGKLLRQNFSGADLKQKIADIRARVVHALISRELVYEAFKRQGGSIPQSAIDERINDIITDQFGGDRKAFLQSAKDRGTSLEKYEDEIERNAITAFMRARFVIEKVTEYYVQNPQLFPQDERLNVTFIVLRGSRPVQSGGVSSPDTDPQAALASQILNEIRGGADASAIAKKYHEDDLYLNDNGSYWISKDGPRTLPSGLPFKWESVEAMKPGETSEVMTTEDKYFSNGSPAQKYRYYYVLCLNDRRPATVASTGKTTQREQYLLNLEGQRVEKEWLDGLRAKAVIQTFSDPGEAGVEAETDSTKAGSSDLGLAATSAGTAQDKTQDLPMGVVVPGKPGFLKSPYAPFALPIDVRGYSSGTVLRCPYTNKLFVIPGATGK